MRSSLQIVEGEEEFKRRPRLVLDLVGGSRRVSISLVASFFLLALEYGLMGMETMESEADEARRLRSYGGGYGGSTATRHHGFGESFQNMIIGIILFWMAATILFVNEGRHVKMQALLQLAETSVHKVDANTVDEASVSSLVHLSGELSQPPRPCQDDVFPRVQAPPQAVKLKRSITMYLWKENKKDEGGQTRYEYEREWCGCYLDSSHFAMSGHENPPPPMTADGQALFRKFSEGLDVGKHVVYGEGVKLGAYNANFRILGKLSSWQDVPMPDQLLAELKLRNYPLAVLSRTGGEKPKSCVEFKFQASPQPVVGDVRLTFEFVPTCPVSVTAVLEVDQNEEYRFEPMKYSHMSCSQKMCGVGEFHSMKTTYLDHLAGADDFEDEPGIFDDLERGLGALKNALLDPAQTCARSLCCFFSCYLGITFYDASAPAEIFTVTEGKKTFQENLAVVKGEAMIMLIFMRLFGFFLMWAGLKKSFDPLLMLFRYIPFLGGFFAAIISALTCLCACGCSVTIGSVAWLFYRPCLGSAIFIVVAGFWVALGYAAGGEDFFTSTLVPAAGFVTSTLAPSLAAPPAAVGAEGAEGAPQALRLLAETGQQWLRARSGSSSVAGWQ